MTNLISFFDEVIRLVDEGRVVDIVFQDFSKPSNTVFPNMFIEKLLKYGLDEQTVRVQKNS